MSGADRLLEPPFPLHLGPVSDLILGGLLRWGLSLVGMMQISMYEEVGSYLVAKNNIVLFLI